MILRGRSRDTYDKRAPKCETLTRVLSPVCTRARMRRNIVEGRRTSVPAKTTGEDLRTELDQSLQRGKLWRAGLSRQASDRAREGAEGEPAARPHVIGARRKARGCGWPVRGARRLISHGPSPSQNWRGALSASPASHLCLTASQPLPATSPSGVSLFPARPYLPLPPHLVPPALVPPSSALYTT